MTERALTKRVRDEIDRRATALEKMHKAIADVPLLVLEEIAVLKRPAKRVRRAQDRTIGAVYDAIRAVNRRVFASRLLAERAKRTVHEGAAHAVHRAAAHH